MKTLLSIAILAVLEFNASDAHADSQGTATTATYVVAGLHCPPCTRTVESSLGRTKGIKSAKVDWVAKSAKVEFDENIITAAQVADTLARTPHMMGGGMKYSGTLALSVPAIQDQETGKAATGALEKLPGVAKVTAFPASHTLTVQFKDRAKLTSAQLIEALNQIGMHGKTY
jgi:copper chaperone CopZ